MVDWSDLHVNYGIMPFSVGMAGLRSRGGASSRGEGDGGAVARHRVQVCENALSSEGDQGEDETELHGGDWGREVGI